MILFVLVGGLVLSVGAVASDSVSSAVLASDEIDPSVARPVSDVVFVLMSFLFGVFVSTHIGRSLGQAVPAPSHTLATSQGAPVVVW